MNCSIAPSVLSFDHGNMRPKVAELVAAGADLIHFDVMDGQFVPPITFGDALIRGMRDLGDTFFEAHLMIRSPERQFEAFRSAGCNRITFHQEATAHSHRLAQTLKEMGLEAGIAINPGTPADAIKGVLDVVDLVLVMTVNPGWGGQEFISGTLEKVRKIRAWSPTVQIEVDGGIDPDTLPAARAGGANVFVVGNYLAKQSNLSEGLRELKALCG